MKLKDIIKSPVITEKSMREAKMGKYTFMVDARSTKFEIRQAIETYFDVRVNKVRTMNIKGKNRWARGYSKKINLPGWKKAIVTLLKGDKIEAFEVE
jgi:large subunit ribosomal protein L23